MTEPAELKSRLALAWAGYHDNVTEPIPQRAYDEADDWLWIIARAGLRLVDVYCRDCGQPVRG